MTPAIAPICGQPTSTSTVTCTPTGADKRNVHIRPSGNSRAAFLRRLRKARPDIHARVLAGELSPHAGMIEAGFRKKPVQRGNLTAPQT